MIVALLNKYRSQILHTKMVQKRFFFSPVCSRRYYPKSNATLTRKSLHFHCTNINNIYMELKVFIFAYYEYRTLVHNTLARTHHSFTSSMLRFSFGRIKCVRCFLFAPIFQRLIKLFQSFKQTFPNQNNRKAQKDVQFVWV